MNTKKRKIGIIVLGMHRSGTSMLTRILSLAGCSLPRTLMAAGIGNELGHWESDSIVRFDDGVLSEAGSDWRDWQAMNPGWYVSPAYEQALNRGVEVMRSEYEGSGLFVVKDPRMCKLMPLWRDVFSQGQVEPLYVIAVRQPSDVAASLEARGIDEPAYGRRVWQISGGLLWLRHVLEAEQQTRGSPRIFVSFSQIMNDSQAVLSRLSGHFGLAWPRRSNLVDQEIAQFIQPEIYRVGQRVRKPGDRQSAWVREVEEIFLRWAESGEDASDFPRLDAALTALNEIGERVGGLIHDAGCAAERVGILETQVADMAAMQGRLESLEGENGWLRNKADTADNLAVEKADLESKLGEAAAGSAEFSTRLAAANEKTNQLSQELAGAEESQLASEAARDEALQQIAQIEAQLAERAAECVEFSTRLATANEKAEARVRKLEAELHERQRDMDVLAAKAAAADECSLQLREVIESSEASRRGFEAAYEQVEARVQLLKDQLCASEAINDENRTLNGKISELESHLAQRKEEAAQAWQELEQARAAKRELSYQIEQAERLRLASEQELTLRAERVEAQTRERIASAEQKIDERHRELATLTRLLATEKHRQGQLAEQADWLRAVSAVVFGRPRWWALMPQSWQRKKTNLRLQRKGLFDGDAYLMNYPDVAASGMDPLKHYINHGMTEGRTF